LNISQGNCVYFIKILDIIGFINQTHSVFSFLLHLSIKIFNFARHSEIIISYLIYISYLTLILFLFCD